MMTVSLYWKPIQKTIWEYRYNIPLKIFCNVDRIRRLSMQVLERYKDRFTTDYEENKKTLDQVAVIRSKALKNEMAGFITKFIKHEQNSKSLAEAEIEEAEEEQPTEESVPQEIVVENAAEESN
ncbi:MAG: hypothetical protein AB1608_00815 [Thermoproteota archaeon]